MIDRTSVGYRQLVKDVAEVVLRRLGSVGSEANNSGPSASSLLVSFPRLTHREAEILSALIGGGTNKSIGSFLGISARTVEVHRSRIRRKMGVNGTAQLVRVALGGSCTENTTPRPGQGGNETRVPWPGALSLNWCGSSTLIVTRKAVRCRTRRSRLVLTATAPRRSLTRRTSRLDRPLASFKGRSANTTYSSVSSWT